MPRDLWVHHFLGDLKLIISADGLMNPNHILMNRRNLLQTLAFFAIGTATCFSESSGQEAPAQPIIAKNVPLHVGESMRYDKGLKITFLSVSKDSRCPMGAFCIVPGDAEVVLRIKVGDQPAKNYRLHTDDQPRHLVIPANDFPTGMVGIPKSYVIKIDGLTPRPRIGKKTLQSDYELSLGISVAL